MTEGGWLDRIKRGTAGAYIGDVTADAERPALTPRALGVAQAMTLLLPGDWTHASGLARATGLAVGTVIPVLARLQAEGWVESEYTGDRHVRRYRLTEAGRTGFEEESRRMRETGE